jgi:hypothetical protein
MNRASYDGYVRAFNARDYDAVCDHFVDPPAMSFFGIEINSRAGLRVFYGFLHSYVHESITVEKFAASDELTAIEATVRLEGYRDLDAETLAAHGYGGLHSIRAGDVQLLHQFIHYHMRDGKFARVTCAMAL